MKKHKFKVNQLVHYYIGSDIVPGLVVWMNNTGNTVEVARVRYKVIERAPYLSEKNVEDIRVIEGEPVTFKSRMGEPHKLKGKNGSKLYPGFCSYRDPSF